MEKIEDEEEGDGGSSPSCQSNCHLTNMTGKKKFLYSQQDVRNSDFPCNKTPENKLFDLKQISVGLLIPRTVSVVSNKIVKRDNVHSVQSKQKQKSNFQVFLSENLYKETLIRHLNEESPYPIVKSSFRVETVYVKKCL